MADHSSDNGSRMSSRAPSTVESTLSELRWLQPPPEDVLLSRPRPKSKRGGTPNTEQLLRLSHIKVPIGRETHRQTRGSIYSSDYLRSPSSAPSFSPPSEVHELPLVGNKGMPGVPGLPLHPWWWCTVSLAVPLALPVVILVLAAVGLFVGGGQPVTRWYVALYAILSITALGVEGVAVTWQLRRLLLQLAELLPAALRASDADGSDVLLTGDSSLDFVLGLVRNKACDLQGKVIADPLDFVQKELDALLHSPKGQVVINTTGIILWVNPSVCKFFGYEIEQLLQENVRLLMPQPYAGQHDHFMSRHLSTGVRTVLGCSREVPVLRKDGTQGIALLSVEDRIDTRDHNNRLFLGTLDFHHQETFLIPIKARLKASAHLDLAVFHTLDEAQDSMVAINAKGVVLYCNKAATQLFRWKRAELVGNNVKVLMGEPFASAHDNFLRTYVEKGERYQQMGQVHVSGIVGSGRDVMARDRMGQRLHIFLMVHRIDVQSGRLADCIFLAKMVHLGTTDPSTRSSSSIYSHKHKARSVVASTVAQKMVVESAPRLSPMLPHRCTLVLLQLRMLEDKEGLQDSVVLHSWFEPFLNLVLESCTNHKGVLHKVVGHELVVLFNTAAEVNTAHRSSAAAFMLELVDSIFKGSLSAVLEVHMAAVTQRAYSAKWGTHDIASGNAIDLAAALLRAQQETQVKNPVIDGALHEELQFSYTCRLVNRLVVNPHHPFDNLVEAFELLSLKEAAEDEWMYQLSAEEAKAGCWAHWQQVWVHLPAPMTSSTPSSGKGRLSQPCSPSNARAALQQHLSLFPQDAAGQTLLSALEDTAPAARPASEQVERCGSMEFWLQYRSPRSDKNHFFGVHPQSLRNQPSILGNSVSPSVRCSSDILLSNVSEEGSGEE